MSSGNHLRLPTYAQACAGAAVSADVSQAALNQDGSNSSDKVIIHPNRMREFKGKPDDGFFYMTLRSIKIGMFFGWTYAEEVCTLPGADYRKFRTYEAALAAYTKAYFQVGGLTLLTGDEVLAASRKLPSRGTHMNPIAVDAEVVPRNITLPSGPLPLPNTVPAPPVTAAGNFKEVIELTDDEESESDAATSAKRKGKGVQRGPAKRTRTTENAEAGPSHINSTGVDNAKEARRAVREALKLMQTHRDADLQRFRAVYTIFETYNARIKSLSARVAELESAQHRDE